LLAPPLVGALLLLCGCPQDIQGLGSDGGAGGPPDAAFVPPACRGGPSVSCESSVANPLLVMRERLTWKCLLPGARAEDGAAPLLGDSFQSDHPEVTLGAQVDSATGEVILQPQAVSKQAFTDGSMTAYLTAYWDGHPDECTTLSLPFGLVGNLWAADETNGRILVFDSGGKQVGGALAAEGIESPRMLAVLKPGEVLVGGKTGSDTVLAVFDLEGRRKRVLGGTEIIANPLRAAAGFGAFAFISSGTLSTKGVLHVVEGEKDPQWNLNQAGGLAADGDVVFLGLLNEPGYKRATSATIPKESADLPYKDSASPASDCDVRATTAMVHLAEGGFVFALQHATSSAPLGHLAWIDGSLRLKASLKHLHANPPGGLSPDGPYDWLEQLQPGVVLGSRDNQPGVERIELSKIGTDAPAASAWTSALSTSWIKGLVKLR
jgi:hypothetical protein